MIEINIVLAFGTLRVKVLCEKLLKFIRLVQKNIFDNTELIGVQVLITLRLGFSVICDKDLGITSNTL